MKNAWTTLTIQDPWHLFQDKVDAALFVSQRWDERSRAEKSVQRWDFYVKLNLQLHP